MAFCGYLQANTAVDVLIGPFVDATDGATLETALTISQADVKLSKNGQTLTQKNDDTTCTADSTTGYYNCELDATDTNTEGTLTLIVNESGALPVRHDFLVISQAAYASIVTAKDTGYMDVNVKAVSEDTTAADNLELACDNYSATRGLAGTALPAAAADAAGGLIISDAGGLDADTLASNVAAILADTGTDGVVVAAGSKTGYSLTATTGLGNQTANITGNLSGSVGSVATGGITAASIATGAIDADALAADAKEEIADTVLGRNINGDSNAGRTVKQALHVLRNKVVVSGGTMTVYDTDDSSSSWTASVTGTSGADPITTIDPT